MSRVQVGYLDGCISPLWLTSLGLRIGRLFGADSLWVPDAHMGAGSDEMWALEAPTVAKTAPSPGAYFDPFQILAVTAARIRGADVGSCVTDPLRHHPMSLAQSFVTLDHISKGRAILGIGNGVAANTEPFGFPWSKQASRLEEALTIIRLLWQSGGEPLSYEGRFWKLEDALFSLPLYAGKPPRIWVASHAPRMLGITGRFADGWVPTVKVSGEEYASNLETIRAAAAKAGRSMDTFVPAQLLYPVVLGRSRDQVIESVMKSRIGAVFALGAPGQLWKEHGLEHPLGEDHKGWYELVPTRLDTEAIDAALASMTPELMVSFIYAGSPAEICEEVAPLVDAGARHLIVSNFGAVFTGELTADPLRLGKLIRKLRRL
jgi:phthiodiolone/phenolphthiodiolone dimycocerosates ketoreductase